MPCAEYSSFEDCCSKNQDKEDPKAYCATIMRKTGGKSFLIGSECQGFSSYTVETKGDKEYFVEGYISTYGVDKVRDLITKSAMQDLYDQADTIMVDVEHEAFKPDAQGYGPYQSRSAIIPVGKVVEKKIDNIGVWVKAKLNHHLDRFKNIWGSLNDGFLKAFSIAFAAPTPNDFIMQADGTRVLVRLKNLLNVALTGNPVNPAATITGVVAKNMDMIFIEKIEDKNKPLEVKMEEKVDIKQEKEETEEEKKKREEEEKKKKEGEAEKKAAPEVEVKAILDRLMAVEALIAKPPEKVEAKSVDFKAIMERLDGIEKTLKEPVFKATATLPEAAKAEEVSVLNFIR